MYSKNQIKCAIFDLDGTLYSNKLIEEIIDVRTNYFLNEWLHENTQVLEKIDPNILSVLDKHSIQRGVYKKYVFGGIEYETLIHPDFCLNNMLASLHCHKYVVSLSPFSHIHKTLEVLEMASLFDGVYSIFDMYPFFEKKVIYQQLMEFHGLVADEVVCVGDSMINDLVPAIKLGISCVYINGAAGNIASDLENISVFPSLDSYMRVLD